MLPTHEGDPIEAQVELVTQFDVGSLHGISAWVTSQRGLARTAHGMDCESGRCAMPNELRSLGPTATELFSVHEAHSE